jgi:hypothetical protein
MKKQRIFGAGICTSVLLILQLSCVQTPTDPLTEVEGSQEGDPSYKYMYIDELPSPRPGTNDVLFTRRIGSLAPKSIVSGLYIISGANKSISLVLKGNFGRSGWLDSDTILYTNYDKGSHLYSYNIQKNESVLLLAIDCLNISVCSNLDLVVYEHNTSIFLLDLINNTSICLISHGLSGIRPDPSISPAGNYLAISRSCNMGQSSIISMLDIRSNTMIDMTAPIDYNMAHWPNWNPDSNVIIYEESYPTDNGTKCLIKTVSLGTNEITDITFGRHPVFADSSVVYYSHWPEGESRIFKIDLKTKTIEQMSY